MWKQTQGENEQSGINSKSHIAEKGNDSYKHKLEGEKWVIIIIVAINPIYLG